MWGIELSVPAGAVIQSALREGLLLIGAGSHVIRLVPPLVIEKEHVDEMITILDKVMED